MFRDLPWGRLILSHSPLPMNPIRPRSLTARGRRKGFRVRDLSLWDADLPQAGLRTHPLGTLSLVFLQGQVMILMLAVSQGSRKHGI